MGLTGMFTSDGCVCKMGMSIGPWFGRNWWRTGLIPCLSWLMGLVHASLFGSFVTVLDKYIWSVVMMVDDCSW